jgi:hypothetical protein
VYASYIDENSRLESDITYELKRWCDSASDGATTEVYSPTIYNSATLLIEFGKRDVISALWKLRRHIYIFRRRRVKHIVSNIGSQLSMKKCNVLLYSMCLYYMSLGLK